MESIKEIVDSELVNEPKLQKFMHEQEHEQNCSKYSHNSNVEALKSDEDALLDSSTNYR